MRRILTLAVLAIVVVLVVPGAGAGAATGVVAGAGGGAGAGAGAAARPRWAWPVPPPHPIVRPYLAPATTYGPGHRGIDVGVGVGASGGAGVEIRAPADGVVHFVGVVVDRPVLSIRHPGGLISSYEPVTSALARGDPVARGQVIGSALAGHCSSPCVHFGVRLEGEYISPLLFLGGVPASVLLPTRDLGEP